MAVAAAEQLNVTEIPVWGSRSVDCFEKLEQIGEGTYGYILKFPVVMTTGAYCMKYDSFV